MTEEGIQLQHRIALERREYWQQQYEAALAADDTEAVKRAADFISHYNRMLTEIGHAQP